MKVLFVVNRPFLVVVVFFFLFFFVFFLVFFFFFSLKNGIFLSVPFSKGRSLHSNSYHLFTVQIAFLARKTHEV